MVWGRVETVSVNVSVGSIGGSSSGGSSSGVGSSSVGGGNSSGGSISSSSSSGGNSSTVVAVAAVHSSDSSSVQSPHSTRSEVLTAVISEASVLHRCYALSLCRHFEIFGRSQCLRLINPEREITLLFRNVGNCSHNDTA